jgi:UDP-N-acetylmuramoylalanine--D-glutamate ligase
MTEKLFNNLSEKDAVILLGAGLTGKALADFCENQKIHYYLIDDKPGFQRDGRYFIGSSSEEAFKQDLYSISFLIPSPGVPLTHPVVLQAKERQIPILGELELAANYLKSEFIAVTGTNGKSTTVKLIDKLLKAAQISAGLKGNIGMPLITAVNEPPKSYYIVEESSYQLELVGNLHHKVAVCMNVTDDHQDRYDDFAAYVDAKRNVIKNSQASDYFIYNADDAYAERMHWKTDAITIPFSLVREFDQGAFVQGDDIVLRLGDKEYRTPLSGCSLKGMHNQENMLAALLAAMLIAPAWDDYVEVLKVFEGLPHRLQKVASVNGVDYYDDSKATNVGAVVMSLASFEGNVVLLAGGKDKQSDFTSLKGLVKHKVKQLVLFGEAKEKMSECLASETNTVMVEGLKEAVKQAKQVASEGDVVLLSPACASFDQFKNFEERGRRFQEYVEGLSS